MTNQVIPAEAVEAAARVTFEAQTFNDWDKLDPKIKHIWIRNARRALEAAAPHLLAAAWDEALKRAAEVAWEHDASASSGVSQIPNPYGTTK